MMSFKWLVFLSAVLAVAMAVPRSHMPPQAHNLNLYSVDLEDDSPAVFADEDEWVKSALEPAQGLLADLPDYTGDMIKPDVLLQTFAQLGKAKKPKNSASIMKLLATLKQSIMTQKLEAEKELNKTKTRYTERAKQRGANQERDDSELEKVKADFQKAEAARQKEDQHEINDLDARLEKFNARQEERQAEAKNQEATLKDLLDAYRERTNQRKKLLELIDTLRSLLSALDKKESVAEGVVNPKIDAAKSANAAIMKVHEAAKKAEADAKAADAAKAAEAPKKEDTKKAMDNAAKEAPKKAE
eukprot:GFYU01001222.1.p1 GENE.GFYU01001222.1~~GFYU01001222.1.p1  ORF type:complete len:301 (-),score=121.64 GFYU01001222.1:367-1269(-)